MLASDTLLRSRSNTARPPAHAPTRTRTRAHAREGAGGPAVRDELLEGALELFGEVRWYRHGASYIRRKLEPLRELGDVAEVLAYLRSQMREPAVKGARFPPGLACDVDGFRGWLELERRRRAKALTSSSAPSSPPATAPAPRVERRAAPATLERARAIARLK
jgi:hypothetical protein